MKSLPERGSIAFGGLLPHAPIVVPELGAGRQPDCRATTAACAELARRLVERAPERLLLVSPHSPRRAEAFGLWSGARLPGSLADFGFAEVAVELPNDAELSRALARHAGAAGLGTWSIPPAPLDHGAVVPLVFLARAGWGGPTSVASLPHAAGPATLAAFGRAVACAADELGGRTALVASGDMSHRLQPGAPAGHHPRAVELDAAVRAAVAEGRAAEVAALDPALRELAAEDVVDPLSVVAAALPARPHGAAVLSYEHPYGVGYLVAVLEDGAASAAPA